MFSKPIYFDFNSVRINPEYYKHLIDIVLYLKTYPDYEAINVEGHTDATGSYEHNMILSEKRAETVAEFFINQDLPKEKIIIRSCGSDKPVAPNDTEEGRAKNRRLEIKLY